MNSYVETRLKHDEKIAYKAHYGWTVWVMPVVVFIFLSLPLLSCLDSPAYESEYDEVYTDTASFTGLYIFVFLLGLGVLLYHYLRVKKAEIVITNQRVIIKTGVFSIRFVGIKLSRVEGIGLQQSAIERMSNSGTIAISALDNDVFTLRHIQQPDLFRKAFQQALEQYIAVREAQ